MRCRHCGLIIQAKPGAVPPPLAPTGSATSVSARTPLPPTLPEATPPAPRTAPPRSKSERRPPAGAPRRGGSWRKGLFLAFCTLLVAGIGLAVYGPYLPRPEPVATDND